MRTGPRGLKNFARPSLGLWGLFSCACVTGTGGELHDTPPLPRAQQVALQGIGSLGPDRMLRVLTYNVAGLPQWVSATRPRHTLPRIGALLNGYDLVLTQEDFAYPDALRMHARFRQQTGSQGRRGVFRLEDGLSRFANHTFAGESHVAWQDCSGILAHGADCSAEKGFSVATHELAPGMWLDVYNLHLDAGGKDGDMTARHRQVRQLAAHVRQHSLGRAVLIGGDTNLKARRPSDMALLADLKKLTGCQDACTVLQCARPELIDRVFFRPSSLLSLEPVDWQIDSRFVDHKDRALSDHVAVAVTFRYRTPPPTSGIARR